MIFLPPRDHEEYSDDDSNDKNYDNDDNDGSNNDSENSDSNNNDNEYDRIISSAGIFEQIKWTSVGAGSHVCLYIRFRIDIRTYMLK
jgi:hypothetical protein